MIQQHEAFDMVLSGNYDMGSQCWPGIGSSGDRQITSAHPSGWNGQYEVRGILRDTSQQTSKGSNEREWAGWRTFWICFFNSLSCLAAFCASRRACFALNYQSVIVISNYRYLLEDVLWLFHVIYGRSQAGLATLQGMDHGRMEQPRSKSETIVEHTRAWNSTCMSLASCRFAIVVSRCGGLLSAMD